MKNILVPIGSNKSAINTLQYAIDFASEIDANVYVISIFKEFSKVGGMSKVNTLLKEESEDNIAKVLKGTDHKNVSVIAHPIKGDPVEGVERLCKHIDIDLMVLSPRSNSVNDEVYLGKMTGKLVKQTDLPTIIVPRDYTFSWPKTVLITFKDGRFTREKMLDPLAFIVKQSQAALHLLHVHTPDATEETRTLEHSVSEWVTSYTNTENATTYQGLLEHFQTFNPDMLCVVRRKRGFFKKLWEKNVVLKKEFFTTKPLLILRGTV
jgi:nucleotide-binding universal stress UspA family protein